jgi:predicted metal-dependent hydrolase
MNREYSKISTKNSRYNFDVREDCIHYSDLEIPYEIVRSKRKTLSIVIAVGGKVTVKIPLSATSADVTRLLVSKGEWIYNAYKKQVIHEQKGIEVKDGALLPFLDQTFRLHVEYNPSRNSANITVKEVEQGHQQTDNILVVETPMINSNFIIDCLKTWYKKNARYIITMRVSQYAKVMDVTYGRISIKSQKSRWGSCSSLGNLNFNWHLVMMPNKILDYVVIHELAHRIEMNHSKEFWDIVSKVCPEYKQRKLWLKEHGLSYELFVKE